MAKDYYLILGLPSSAGAEEVRTAYRRRALELHPDHSGGASDPFVDLQEAYAVLSNPELRRAYDQQRSRHHVRRRSVAEPLRAPGRHAESFRDQQRGGSVEPIALWDDFETYAPGYEEVADRWWGNYKAGSRRKGESIESLTVEVPLSREEARWGGEIELRVPVKALCGLCGGRGALAYYECWACGGRGSRLVDQPLWVRHPAGLLGDHEVAIALEQFGIENFYLTVRFRVK
jgi:molecular chaperone DnaJ